MNRDTYYTVSEAAKVLGVTSTTGAWERSLQAEGLPVQLPEPTEVPDTRVRGLAQEGRIEGERTEGGWDLFRYSVHPSGTIEGS